MRKLRHRLKNIITLSLQASDGPGLNIGQIAPKYIHVHKNIYKYIYKYAPYDTVKGSETAKVKPMNH